MESNNSSSCTPSFSHYTAATRASSFEGFFSHSGNFSSPMMVPHDEPSPNQSNDDKRKQTCRNEREANNYKSSEKRGRNAPKTSQYMGVSRQGGRYEASIWDSTTVLKPGNKKGKYNANVYLGTFENEVDAAKARDLFALKIFGQDARTNFPPSIYEKELFEMKDMSREECIAAFKRMGNDDKMKSMISKGLSVYRGVFRLSEKNKWQTRLAKGKDFRSLYVGTFDSEEEAARAHDIAMIRLKGPNAVIDLNFDRRSYDIEGILRSAKIPIGKGASKTIQKCTAEEILLRLAYNSNNPNPSSHSITSSEQCHLNPNNLANTDDAGVSFQIDEPMSGVIAVPIGDPSEAENGMVANSESFANADNDDHLKFPPPYVFSEFPLEVEDDAESVWDAVYGESWMDHMMSGNDSVNDFGKGLDSTADIDWSFTEDEPQEHAPTRSNQTNK